MSFKVAVVDYPQPFLWLMELGLGPIVNLHMVEPCYNVVVVETHATLTVRPIED